MKLSFEHDLAVGAFPAVLDKASMGKKICKAMIAYFENVKVHHKANASYSASMRDLAPSGEEMTVRDVSLSLLLMVVVRCL